MFKKAVIAAALFALIPAASAQVADPMADDGVGLRGDLVYGEKTAKVEVMEYGSFTCPHCAHFTSDVLPKLKAEYIDTGKVRFIFRNFVRDRYDMAVAAISRCTTEDATAKKMTEDFFIKQNDWVRASNPYEAMATIAKENGVETDALGDCISSRGLQEHMVEMRNFGIETYKIDAVPTIFVNGAEVKDHTFEGLKKAIDAAL